MKNRFSRYFHMNLICVALALICISPPIQRTFPQVTSDGQSRIQLDVPYEPSSEEVVRAMLEIAKVDKNDLVYDLGCGDGRIVIAAAQKAGARGVGVDLDPKRIRESEENARKASVTDRVQFFQQDLFQTQIGDATVIMLYLWPEVNLKLRPKLFRELKPGARVVSHSHNMGNWEPDQTITTSEAHHVHFWVIPANVTGTWEWKMRGERKRYVLNLNQQFQKVSGTLRLGSDEILLQNIELRGDRLEFSLTRSFNGQVQTLRVMGRVRGGLIEGRTEDTTVGSQGKQTWIARRNPSTMKPIDR